MIGRSYQSVWIFTSETIKWISFKFYNRVYEKSCQAFLIFLHRSNATRTFTWNSYNFISPSYTKVYYYIKYKTFISNGFLFGEYLKKYKQNNLTLHSVIRFATFHFDLQQYILYKNEWIPRKRQCEKLPSSHMYFDGLYLFSLYYYLTDLWWIKGMGLKNTGKWARKYN